LAGGEKEEVMSIFDFDIPERAFTIKCPYSTGDCELPCRFCEDEASPCYGAGLVFIDPKILVEEIHQDPNKLEGILRALFNLRHPDDDDVWTSDVQGSNVPLDKILNETECFVSFRKFIDFLREHPEEVDGFITWFVENGHVVY
jgi:hypothetical protein